ncbi:phosphoribosylglycinamide formyltransferase [Chelonobacter oris]|uniref:phosphoribosylglycinamide formyltransferase n=1 Tax=Chelonobacter oris TaxID=505317 RepID=UPI0024499E40|nr:phosphoribosylglycinamide formyltransferase [Chelonobacter oris]MDH3001427.1 phosphoribosylglycinamide formyltransferase [Chelonobacter oris]
MNIAFLFSGRGSLLESVINGMKESNTDSKLSLIITNNPTINKNDFLEYNFHIVDHKKHENRESFEKTITNLLEENNINLIVLGGFRRIFSPSFVKKYGEMTINTHPSILPAFPGDKAQLKAINYGVKLTGATIHFINEHVDNGPIIDQGFVKITTKTTEEELKEEIIKVEKDLIRKAVSDFINKKLIIKENKVINIED